MQLPSAPRHFNNRPNFISPSSTLYRRFTTFELFPCYVAHGRFFLIRRSIDGSAKSYLLIIYDICNFLHLLPCDTFAYNPTIFAPKSNKTPLILSLKRMFKTFFTLCGIRGILNSILFVFFLFYRYNAVNFFEMSYLLNANSNQVQNFQRHRHAQF